MGLILTWFVAWPILPVLFGSSVWSSFIQTNPIIEKSFESPNIPQRVLKKIQSLGHERLIWAHMSAFALIDAAWMIKRCGRDMHELLCNSQRYVYSLLFHGLLFHYFFRYDYVYVISVYA